MGGLLDQWMCSSVAIWLEGIATPLIVALAGVWVERSRRKTYRAILAESSSGLVLLDVRRGGRTLLVMRAEDRVEFTAAMRRLQAPEAGR